MMRRMPVSEVLKVAEVHARHSETEFRRRALAVSLDTLERRWLELKKPATIVTLMYMMLDERLRRQVCGLVVVVELPWASEDDRQKR